MVHQGFYTKMINYLLDKKLILFIVLILCLVNFIIFREIDTQLIERNKKYIETILRNESIISNSYAIAKTLVDMENSSFFSCGRLIEFNKFERIYFDTYSNKNCSKKISWLLLSSNTEFRGVNGLVYKFYFSIVRQTATLILEFVIYYLILIISNYINRRFLNMQLSHNAKVAILEIEKKSISDINRQVSHDVASPLSALRMMTKLIQNVDPEVKSILINSIDRTQNIFESLRNVHMIEKINDISKLISDIILEKKFFINNEEVFNLINNSNNGCVVFANTVDLQRIVSNIFNNSLEAYSTKNLGHINVLIDELILEGINFLSIKIIDNAGGVPERLLKNIGTEGFSYGKSNNHSSGSGIGLFDAQKKIKSWGGEILFYNNNNPGFTVEIRLRVI